MYYNKIILIGRATKNFEPKSEKFGKFSIAVRDEMDKEKTEFFDCVVMGQKQLEYLFPRIVKGVLLMVEGRIQSNDYQGKKYYQVVAEKVRILTKSDSAVSDNPSGSFSGSSSGIADHDIPTADMLDNQNPMLFP